MGAPSLNDVKAQMTVWLAATRSDSYSLTDLIAQALHHFAAQYIDPSNGGVTIAVWNHSQVFTLVENQTDYLFSGEGEASTDASAALVQVGLGVLVPNLDYSVLPDRIRLISPPSAQDVALGQPLVVRVHRA